MNSSKPDGSPQPVSTPAMAMLKPAYVLYGLLTWIVFAVCALLAVLAVLIVPGVDRRRRAASAIARSFLWVTAMPLRRRHLERLPAGQCVVVANHASYLDGLVMKAALPPRFNYVVKREMEGVPLAGLLLRRIGTEFVDRFDRHKGASDARRVLRTAKSGQSLVFFPEGTFHNTPGLLRFHSGAFATAVRAGCPVVPAVIRGTRRVLPGSRLLPHWGEIEVEFLEPLSVSSSEGETAAAELRDRARAAILARLDEPDAA
jgi:1-acyl-sn-glycerol-3-phosphate acyltransferase